MVMEMSASPLLDKPNSDVWNEIVNERWMISEFKGSACGLTSAVIIYNSDRLPLEKVDQVQDGPAERGEIRIEADVKDISVV